MSLVVNPLKEAMYSYSPLQSFIPVLFCKVVNMSQLLMAFLTHLQTHLCLVHRSAADCGLRRNLELDLMIT